MKRKDFLGMLGGLPLVGGLPFLSSLGDRRGALPDPAAMRINTPELPLDTAGKRKAYTRELLRVLCDELGPRPTGSTAYASGAKIIRDEMERTLPDVAYDRYSFEKWELIEQPEFAIGDQHIEAWPRHGGPGTSPEGITGRLQKRENRFYLAGSGGEEIARLMVSSYGRAIPSRYRATDDVPEFGVGKQDVPLFEKAVREGTPCTYKAWSRFTPGSEGINVVGRIPGRRKDEILFIAHLDTVYTSPGANDNTASVLVMLMLAHAASQRQHDHTLTFIAADAEEYSYLGAHNYANQRMADGTMEDIRYVINFDSLTYGMNLWVNSLNEDLKEMIRSIHEDLDLGTTPRYSDSDGFIMDSVPFRPSGARAAHVNSRGYDEKTLPVYHRPNDYGRDVPLDTVESSFQVFDEFIRRADKT